jgi:hypothetical protein
MRGKELTTKWEHLIKTHLRRNEIVNITAEQWGADLIRITWDHIIAIWLQRNIEIHGSSETEQTERRKKKLIDEIKTIQQQHSQSSSITTNTDSCG